MSAKFNPKVETPKFGIAWVPWDADEEMDSIAVKGWNEYVELTKNKLAFEYRSAVLASRHRTRLRELYGNGETWTQKNGEVIRIQDMTPNHAGNAYRLMERKFSRHAMYLQCGVGELYDTPLIQALRIRSDDPETILDRVRDARSKRRYEKGKK